jgi:hypothetical protein
MTSYISTYFIIGFLWSFFMKVIHDFLPHINLDDLTKKEKEEYKKATEEYTIGQLIYIVITWPIWIYFFIKEFIFRRLK